MYRVAGVLLLLVGVAGCQETGQIVFTGQTMGTTYVVKVVAEEVDRDRLQTEIDARLVAVNDAMSTYIPTSEISRFNQAPVGEWFPASAGLIEVVRLAQDIHSLSAGRYDVTIGPLVNLWGFGPTPTDDMEAPSAGAIAETMSKVGMNHLRIRDDALMKDVPIYLDLSSVAKGYGVDQVATVLDAHGLSNYLVEIGGELLARGMNERDTYWRVAVERPELGPRSAVTAIELVDEAIATSGDYRNYIEIDGTRYSHLIDPATGEPIHHNLASVSVIAPTTALADAFATAIFVMGADEGLALAEAQGLPVFVIIKQSDGFEVRHSSAFEDYL